MPNVKSAKKRVKTNKRDRVRNKTALSELRSALKETRTALQNGDKEAVEKTLPRTLSLIGRTAKKGIIHPNKASRQESRLMKKVNALRKSQ